MNTNTTDPVREFPSLGRIIRDWLVPLEGGNSHYIINQRDIEALEAALATEQASVQTKVPEWQPIETCPTDGTVVMVHVPGHLKPIYSRGDDYHGGYAYWLEGATHWMPLPAAPSHKVGIGGEDRHRSMSCRY